MGRGREGGRVIGDRGQKGERVEQGVEGRRGSWRGKSRGGGGEEKGEKWAGVTGRG